VKLLYSITLVLRDVTVIW